MRKTYFIWMFIGVLFLNACDTKKQHAKNNESTSEETSYFGQEPPGMTPQLFAPGLVSVNGRYEYAVSFSPDFKELYFSGEKEDSPQEVHFSELKEGTWTTPKKITFTKGKKKSEFEAFVNPQGNKLFFAAYDSIFSDEKIWIAQRLGQSWSEAEPLDSPINEDLVFYPNVAKNGDLFYTSISKGKMYYAPNKNGNYPEVHELDIEYGTHGFISPSQDFILVDAKKENDNTKDRDIHVCFKRPNGSWTQPINLGTSVNSDYTETCPSLTPDGKYLFFSRYNEEGELSNIYWVDAKVIDAVKPASLVLEGPYLGQKPPGFTAIPFAPGIVNTEHRELSGFFSPDLKEFYFNRNGGSYEKHELVVFKNIENRWSESYVMPRIGRPVFSPDGKTLHLGKKYMVRTGTGWSEVKSLGSYFEDIRIMRLTSSSKGTFVFDEVGSEDGDGVIRYSRLINGKREAPKPFSKEINTGKYNAHPFIAPDESYIIWDGERESGYGDSDLYISFQQKDGSWGKAINMGSTINTEAWESTAFVTPDGKYLFFNRNVGSSNYENVDIFWVDAKVIEDLRPKP
ncbi:hypothetical protein [Flagellimonas sp. S3867]|uniref:hypothetical protein n=1 Tax=Flagellimonas sp. S3867 TaxID=2768063 RepID=UPI001CC25A3F|nr:hypothetical protein [Flagellimonas sp. S3867]